MVNIDVQSIHSSATEVSSIEVALKLQVEETSFGASCLDATKTNA